MESNPIATSFASARYDEIGAACSATRRPDPRIASRILVRRPASDLRSGERQQKHGGLLGMPETDLGYRLGVSGGARGASRREAQT